MLLIGTIPAVWLVTSLAVLLLLPARWGGRWMASRGTNSFQGVLLCVAAAKLFVVWTAASLVFARSGSLPHVETGKSGFGIFLDAVLFFVPVFSALMPGFPGNPKAFYRRGSRVSADWPRGLIILIAFFAVLIMFVWGAIENNRDPNSESLKRVTIYFVVFYVFSLVGVAFFSD